MTTTLKPFTLRLPKDLHQEVGTASWQRRQSMSEFINEAIESYLSEQAKDSDD